MYKIWLLWGLQALQKPSAKTGGRENKELGNEKNNDI